MAYIVVRNGPKWSNVFRLVEGRTVTIGRAPTNQIVINDDRCSRHHAEVFSSHGEWKLRDLDSRNGIDIAGQKLQGDHTLTPGDVFHVAKAALAFVDDLETAFSDSSDVRQVKELVENEDPGTEVDQVKTIPLTGDDPTTITHRRGKTRYLDAEDPDGDGPRVEGGSPQCDAAVQTGFRSGRHQRRETGCPALTRLSVRRDQR